MNEQQKNIIAGVINTLNAIEVKGKENLDMLLGSILALEQINMSDETEGKENG